jgi:hypothetical protein
MDHLHRTLAGIRDKARELRDIFGDDVRARTLEWAVLQVEASIASDAAQLVSLFEASRVSGYSMEHLARLVREGKIPDARPHGTKGRLVFRKSDIPLKTQSHYVGETDTHDLASRLFQGKEGR